MKVKPTLKKTKQYKTKWIKEAKENSRECGIIPNQNQYSMAIRRWHKMCKNSVIKLEAE